MKLDKFHNRLDNPADMDSEKLNRHIEAHLLGGDEHVDTYDVSVNTTSKTATARRFRPAYLSWIAVVVVVALAIALPMTLTNRGNGDGIVPPTFPEGPSDFYCDSSQYVIKKISQSINDYASVIGWDISKLDFDNIVYQIDSQRAYVSNKDEETVYCIGQAGYALHGNDAHELNTYVAPHNIKIDTFYVYYQMCKVMELDSVTVNYYYDSNKKIEYIYLNKNKYTYYFQMMGSEEGTLLGYIQQILLI